MLYTLHLLKCQAKLVIMPHKDPDARRAANRASYARHKKLVGDKVKAYKAELRRKWREFKSTLACKVCGETDPSALDFHHPNPSPADKKVHILIRNCALKAAIEEAKKCEVLCASCHRKHHYADRLAKKKNPTL